MWSIAVAVVLSQTCYRLPFSNPTLSDGWGSTCCGRTNPHRGVDFPQARGTAIPSVADGVVVLKTYNGCLGNVVVVQHPDGMFSGYCHMSVGSPLGIGQGVAKGQIVGSVGATGTCAQGSHLHLTMSPSVGGYASGTTVDPYAFIVARSTCNRPPIGALDAATCAGVTGWAQDPDVPSSAIAAHVYFDGPAGSAAGTGLATRADVSRSDLCSALGSCAHGFSLAPPPAFLDGKDHPVFAYAIDSSGGGNPLIGQKTFRCDATTRPELGVGWVRRHIPSPEVLAAWKLTTLDIAPIADATLEAIPLGPDLTAKPELVKSENAPPIFVREAGVLRQVPSPAAMTAWRFGAFASIPAAVLAEDLTGPAWPATPFLAKGSGSAVYFLDAAPALDAAIMLDDFPRQLTAGTTARARVRFENKGSLAFGAETWLVSTEPSRLCDPSWPSCTRAGLLNDDGEVTLTLRAPRDPGLARVCFGLARGTHAYPDTARFCHDVKISPVGAPLPRAARDETVTAGCSSTGGAAAAVFGLWALLFAAPRRGQNEEPAASPAETSDPEEATTSSRPSASSGTPRAPTRRSSPGR